MSMALIPSARRPQQHPQPWAALLELFYSRAGLRLPLLARLERDEVPEPYRGLLVHSHDLTPTLEAFYGQRLGLKVLSRRREGTSYLREVVLQLAGSGQRVGYGAIRIQLERLPRASAQSVLENQVPFGSILARDGIAHLGWPQAFFSADPDAYMQAALGLDHAGKLYGRRNVLLDGSRRLLADVLEILAPVASLTK